MSKKGQLTHEASTSVLGQSKMFDQGQGQYQRTGANIGDRKASTHPRPESKKNQACTVGVGYEIRQVKDVDCVAQSFFCDFTLILKWYDQSFKSWLGKTNKSDPTPIPVPLHLAHVPAHYIVNVVDLPRRDEAAYLAPKDPPGVITYEAMYTGLLSEFMELEMFPLDTQDLSISVRFQDTSVKCKSLGPKDKFQRIRDSVEMAEWLVYQPVTDVVVGKAGRSCYSVKLRIYRQAGYYVWNVLLPLALFSFGTFWSFLYEPDDWYSRSNLIFQILLAFLALKFVIASSLPRVSFFTLLDLYLFPTYVFIVLMISYCAVVKGLYVAEIFQPGDPEGRFYDLVFACCSGVLWIIGNWIFSIRWMGIDAAQRSRMGELLDLPSQVNSVNILSEFIGSVGNEEEEENGGDDFITLNQVKGVDSVGIGFEVRQVKDINCITQTFFCDFSLIVKFYNDVAWKRLKKDPSVHVSKEEALVPEHYIANAVDLALRDEEIAVASGDPQGVMTYTAMYSGHLAEFMELEFFPLDLQDLSISVRFQDTKTRCKTMGPPDKFQRMRDSIALTEWSMYEPHTTVEVGKQGRALWSLKLKIYRESGFYIWNVALPVALFSFISFFAFLYDADDWYSRSCHVLMIILAVVTFKFIIADQMPKVPFFVLLDLYLFPSFMFLIFMLTYFAFMKLPFLMGVFEHGSMKAREIDLIVALFMYLFWLAGNVFFAHRWRKIGARQRSSLGKMLDLPSQTSKVNIVETFVKIGSSDGADDEEEPGPDEIRLEDIKKGSPVGIGYEIRQVKDIDCIRQIFWSDFTLIMKYYDEELSKRQRPAGKNVPLKPWEARTPDHYIANAVEISLKDQQSFLSSSDPPGVVTYEAMYTGILAEFMELEYFPLDVQDLSISVRFQNTSVTCRTLGPADQWQRIRDSIGMTEWAMYDPVTSVEVGKQGRSCWSLQMKIYRQSGYYVWQVMTPMGLFSLMSFYAFAYEADMWYERSTHAVNVLLGFVTFKFVIADSMPKVPFFVLIDLYLLPTFCFLIALVVEFGLMKLVFLIDVFESGSPFARTVDLIIGAVFFGIWLVCNVFFGSRFGRVDAQQRCSLGKLLDLPTQKSTDNVIAVAVRTLMGTAGTGSEDAQDLDENLQDTARTSTSLTDPTPRSGYSGLPSSVGSTSSSYGIDSGRDLVLQPNNDVQTAPLLPPMNHGSPSRHEKGDGSPREVQIAYSENGQPLPRPNAKPGCQCQIM